MALGANIRRHRIASGLTLEQLSDRSGVDVGTINALENRDSRRSSYAVAIARGLGMTAEQLADDAGLPAAVNLTDNPDYPAIRRVRFKLSAGVSGFAVEYLEGDDAPIVFQRKWYTSRGLRPDRLFAVKVANGSMEPGLHHGDTVVVNTDQTTPKDGVVFAVNYEGELAIKRLVRDAGAWWLHSDNPVHPRKLCDENCIVIGEIVHKQSEHI
jgi:phage repressor protein C with HTH and peptisase S24 domain